MRLADIEFVDQRTLTLAIDVAMLLEKSEKHAGSRLGSVYARSAITNAALLLECVSNSCLFSLALPTRLLEELDKLPVLAKLDYYLFCRTGKHVDRGCREVELAADTLRLRDHIVHPKPKPGSNAGVSDNQYVDYGATKGLGIALDNRDWNHNDGRKVSNAVVRFLKKFFHEWCGHEKGRVTCLLVMRERDLIHRELQAWVTICAPELKIIEKWLPELLDIMDLRAVQHGG